MTMVFAFCVREVRLVWKAVCDDLAGHVRVPRRDPASPSGGDCGCEPGEPVLVPTDLDVVFGQVAVGYPDETGDVAHGGSSARDRRSRSPIERADSGLLADGIIGVPTAPRGRAEIHPRWSARAVDPRYHSSCVCVTVRPSVQWRWCGGDGSGMTWQLCACSPRVSAAKAGRSDKPNGARTGTVLEFCRYLSSCDLQPFASRSCPGTL